MDDGPAVQEMFEFEAGPDPIAYWCKGHVDKLDFIDVVDREFGHVYTTNLVQHAFARNVPIGRNRPGEMIIYLDVEPGRGAYKITFIDLIA